MALVLPQNLLPPFAGGVTGLASSVVAETTPGQAPAVGVSTLAAREDHTHGTPTQMHTLYWSAGSYPGSALELNMRFGALSVADVSAFPPVADARVTRYRVVGGFRVVSLHYFEAFSPANPNAVTVRLYRADGATLIATAVKPGGVAFADFTLAAPVSIPNGEILRCTWQSVVGAVGGYQGLAQVNGVVG